MRYNLGITARVVRAFFFYRHHSEFRQELQ
jgi:hypothetical protein